MILTRYRIGRFAEKSFQPIHCTGTDNRTQWNKTPHTP